MSCTEGLDINPFAIELAKVTMMLAHKLAIDELHITENCLPLDNLDNNFKACDALIDHNGQRTVWPEANVIIGNPPFMGAKRLKPERGVDYVKNLRKLYPEVPGMADYCVYWFRRAHDCLKTCTVEDPISGRAGLVGTQNIRNNQSRVGGLDYIVNSGTIVEAIDNQPWSGQAAVHVSIVNWVKSQETSILPKSKKIWFKEEPINILKKRVKNRSQIKNYELNYREVSYINSALSDQADVSKAKILICNTSPQLVFQGVTPGHKGFILSEIEYKQLLEKTPKSKEIIYPYIVGDEILSGSCSTNRFILDFDQMSLLEAQSFKAPFEHIKLKVLPSRQQALEKGKDLLGKPRSHHKHFLERWWQLSWGRAEMIQALSKLSRYLVCSRVTKRPIFVFLHSDVRPGDALQVFAFEDDYSFGILQSSAHWQWFITKCSKFGESLRYTPESIFDTFPWPQSPTRTVIKEIAEAGCLIRKLRVKFMEDNEGGLRALYNTLDIPGKNQLNDAHLVLDEAVFKAYGFSPKKDVLAQLLNLNFEIAKRFERDDLTLTAPGIPSNYPHPKELITVDCFGLSNK